VRFINYFCGGGVVVLGEGVAFVGGAVCGVAVPGVVLGTVPGVEQGVLAVAAQGG
jgi:hypothetical protein